MLPPAAPVLVVPRIHLTHLVGRTAGVLDGLDQMGVGLGGVDQGVVRGAVVVLHLLQGQDVRALQPVHDQGGEAGEAGGDRRVEVLHVEGGHGQLVRRRGHGRLARVRRLEGRARACSL